MIIKNRIVFADIEAELENARSKFPGTEHVMNALTEEVGELAKDLLHLQYEPAKGKTASTVYAEAIQVAAMAIRVATEGDTTFPAYKPEDVQ